MRAFGGSTSIPLSCLCEKSCLLVSCCAGDRCDMTDNDEDHNRSKRPSVENRVWSSTIRILGGWMIERSDNIVCCLHRAQKDEEHEFLGLASKSRSIISPDLTLKPVALGFSVWATRPTATV
jgi:hypothetical protein